MAGDSPQEIMKAVKFYCIIGLCLFCCTFLTVKVATLEFFDKGARGFDTFDMVLGLLIAATKATLVAAIFMHLNHEKKMIHWIFFGSIFFALIGFLIFYLAFWDPISFPGFYLG